jgi:hypothetical protein
MPHQAGVLNEIPPQPPTNLAVPGYRLHDALERRPQEPVFQPGDPTQTACNLILGALDLALPSGQARTQLECARDLMPAPALICLGYQEALEALISGAPEALPDADHFANGIARILEELGSTGDFLVVCTVPNPADTAFCCSLDAAAEVCCVEREVLEDLFGLGPEVLVTVHGLNEIGVQLFGGVEGALPDGAWVPVATAAAVEQRLLQINAAVRGVAARRGAVVCDFHATCRCLARTGVDASGRRLTGTYLGGLYGLSGAYPGAAGHAVLANAALAALNAAGVTHCPPIDLGRVAATDPVAQYRPAMGRRWRRFEARLRDPAPAIEARPPAGADPERDIDVRPDPPPRTRLRLPPGGEQVLPLQKAASYFGDGISVLHCTTPEDARWGNGGESLFGGLAMVDSHLEGRLRIRFDRPLGRSVRFQVSFEGDLVGDDGVLAAPRYFRMPFRHNSVSDPPGLVSHGDLDLETGEVSGLEIHARFHSEALAALVGVNPTFPRQPLSFPGAYGSAWARFDPRPDGLLDFSFYGSTFVPLGAETRWPLNFHSEDGHFATVPAAGTVMHPHLCLSTRQPDPVSAGTRAPLLPCNAIRELTLHTRNSAFGDEFTLEVPQLGGRARGRSHVLGRVQVQFGPRCGNSVPIAVTCLRPAGVMSELPASPITEVFPGRLYPGPDGFYELLRFPTRTYALDDLSILDDPFDVAIGAVDLETGRSLTDMLHRAFIHQDLIFALLRVEPRTPQASFLFRGPCSFESGSQGRLVYRFRGTVRVPYPEGFLFPGPDLSTAFRVGSNSALDPFLWIRAIETGASANPATGSASEVVASTGDVFSYAYRIPAGAGERAEFEYENHSQEGRFRLHSLTSVAFTSSLTGGAGEPDTVTFSGFGLWTKDGHQSLQQVAAQICRSPAAPYVGIQIDRGAVSNVNTKPPEDADAEP